SQKSRPDRSVFVLQKRYFFLQNTRPYGLAFLV
ncbi:MAG: hypothetical protein ACJA1C_002323, partial [Crocinitomicaceae bacterium]